jgi:hypothetical protein
MVVLSMCLTMVSAAVLSALPVEVPPRLLEMLVHGCHRRRK